MGMNFDLWEERVKSALLGGKKHTYPGFPRTKKEGRKKGMRSIEGHCCQLCQQTLRQRLEVNLL